MTKDPMMGIHPDHLDEPAQHGGGVVASKPASEIVAPLLERGVGGFEVLGCGVCGQCVHGHGSTFFGK